jgi:hypothetical protein
MSFVPICWKAVSQYYYGRHTFCIDCTHHSLFFAAIARRLLSKILDRHYTPLVTIFITIFSLLLPSFYVAVLTFLQEMVPTSLLITMAFSRETAPFPALVHKAVQNGQDATV